MTEIIRPFEGLEIITPDLIRKDERGLVWHVDINPKENRITLFKRCAGSLSGGGYHLPEHPTRNPEWSLLIDGEWTLYCKHILKGNEYTGRFSAPSMFKAYPYVYHAMRAETDIVYTDLHPDDVGREYNVNVKELHDVLKNSEVYERFVQRTTNRSK